MFHVRLRFSISSESKKSWRPQSACLALCVQRIPRFTKHFYCGKSRNCPACLHLGTAVSLSQHCKDSGLCLAHHPSAVFPLPREVWGYVGAGGAWGPPAPHLPPVLDRPWSLSQGGDSIPSQGHCREGTWGRAAFSFRLHIWQFKGCCSTLLLSNLEIILMWISGDSTEETVVL